MSNSKVVPAYDNTAGFQYDEASAYEEPQELYHTVGPGVSGMAPPLANQGPPQLPQRGANKPKGIATTNTNNTESVIERESAPPLIMTSDPSKLQAKFQKALVTTNSAVDDAFAMVTFPFTILVNFIHHLLRFILRGLIRPLMVDTLLMFVEYFWRPLWNTMFKPCINSMFGASMALIDLILICIKPAVILLKAIRCVEINYVKNGRIQEV